VIGVPGNHFFDGCDGDVVEAVRGSIDALVDHGAQLRTVELPMIDRMEAICSVIVAAEAAAFHGGTLRGSAEGFTPVTRAVVEEGHFVLAVDYLNALRARVLFREAWSEALSGVDALLFPSLPTTASVIGDEVMHHPDGTEEPLATAFRRTSLAANLAELPALSLPVGLSRDGLPIGLQVVGSPFADATVLRVGNTAESLVDWSAAARPAAVVAPVG
jgi:aspartyl-tRNA(Asn)/glutamyl-tRNA(Gln) amidotransferase subunit A